MCPRGQGRPLGLHLCGLLFTAKILQEAVHLTSPYLGQITYKIEQQNARF